MATTRYATLPDVPRPAGPEPVSPLRDFLCLIGEISAAVCGISGAPCIKSRLPDFHVIWGIITHTWPSAAKVEDVCSTTYVMSCETEIAIYASAFSLAVRETRLSVATVTLGTGNRLRAAIRGAIEATRGTAVVRELSSRKLLVVPMESVITLFPSAMDAIRARPAIAFVQADMVGGVSDDAVALRGYVKRRGPALIVTAIF